VIDEILSLITQRRKEINNTPLDVPITPDMLSIFITANTDRDLSERTTNKTDNEPMTDDIIIGNMMEVIAGSINTIADLTYYICYHLALHSEVKEQVFKEIDLKFSHDQQVTYEDLKLPYCEAVIKEVS